ncbi:hypothetical protein GJ496_007793 [Pomphorhynchus laevis]|nr:hypothetical protein GJ496_007793 [Pomphorhynchus laevis]
MLWRSMFSKFGIQTRKLARALVDLGIRISTKTMRAGSLEALTVCRLIAIRKIMMLTGQQVFEVSGLIKSTS